MPSNRPLIDRVTPRDRAKAKLRQGFIVFLIGLITSGACYLLGFIVFWTVIVAVVGIFWMLTGLITLLTGVE